MFMVKVSERHNNPKNFCVWILSAIQNNFAADITAYVIVLLFCVAGLSPTSVSTTDSGIDPGSPPRNGKNSVKCLNWKLSCSFFHLNFKTLYPGFELFCRSFGSGLLQRLWFFQNIRCYGNEYMAMIQPIGSLLTSILFQSTFKAS